MPLILRSVKGSKLSIAEMDNNLLYLQSLALSGSTSGITSDLGVKAAFFSTPQTIAVNQQIPENQNAMMFGPTVTIAPSVNVVVGGNSVLKIT